MGYTTQRKKECVFKLVQSHKVGTGIICNDNLDVKIIDNMILDINKDLDISDKTRKNKCCLLELLFRLTTKYTFYSYDKIWLHQ